MLDMLGGEMLLGNVARGAADPQHRAALVEHDPGVDSDPAVVTLRGHDMGHVVLDFAVALEQREKTPVGHVGSACFEVEEAAADEILGPSPNMSCDAPFK